MIFNQLIYDLASTKLAREIGSVTIISIDITDVYLSDSSSLFRTFI